MINYHVWLYIELFFVQIASLILLTCCACSVLYLMTKRQKIKPVYKTNVDALIGKEAIVLERIAYSTFEPWGLVKVGGENWAAGSLTGDSIEPGEYVEIVDLIGCHLMVKKLNNKSNITKEIL